MGLYVNQTPDKWPSLLACDLETTGLDPHSDKILSVALSDGEDTWIFLHFSPVFAGLGSLFMDSGIEFVFHNAKFDIKFLKRRFGAEFPRVFDTFLAEQVIHAGENLPASLDQVLARNLGVIMDKGTRAEFIEHPGFVKRPVTPTQLSYMKEDVIHLLPLREKQLEKVKEAGLERALQLEFDVVEATAALELGGVRLDVDKWFEQVAWFEEQKSLALENMRTLLGEDFSVVVPGKKAGKHIDKRIELDDINFASPIQLLSVLRQFGITVNDTRDSTLQELAKAKGTAAELTRHLLNFRKWNKRVGFSYDEHVNKATGKIHPDYHQLGARTGRFSCSNPNLQQVPRPGHDKEEPNMRHLWTADTPDYVLIRADYSQQEARVMADTSGDEAMIDACNNEDVYLAAARKMYGNHIEKGSEERQLMKVFFLSSLYGVGVAHLHEVSGLPMKDCDRIRSAIKSQFSGAAYFAKKMERHLATYGWVQTASGRRRYFPDRATRTYMAAVNTPIQGTAVDMFKLAMARIHRHLTNAIKEGKIDSNTRIIMLVHDELVVHARKDEAEEIAEIVKTLMEEAGSELCPRVRHIAEVDWAYTWDK